MRFRREGGRLPLIEEFMRTGHEPAPGESSYLNEFIFEGNESCPRTPMLTAMKRFGQRDFIEMLCNFRHETREIDNVSMDYALLAAAVAAGRLTLRETIQHPAEWGVFPGLADDWPGCHRFWGMNNSILTAALAAASTACLESGDMQKAAINRALAHDLLEIKRTESGASDNYFDFCDRVADFSFQLMAATYLLENNGASTSAANFLVPIDDDGPMDFLMAIGSAFACAGGILRIKRGLCGLPLDEADRLEAKLSLDAARCVGLSAICEVNVDSGVVDYAES
ncbi:MAG: hypothetical protein LBE84_12715 [Planctomycetota bacterium]|jgi:hypothetical protein|nr:hypothetical protein [Planctomycetota bacterium]